GKAVSQRWAIGSRAIDVLRAPCPTTPQSAHTPRPASWRHPVGCPSQSGCHPWKCRFIDEARRCPGRYRIDWRRGYECGRGVRLIPNLLECKAAFVERLRRGGDLPPVQILLPDGTTVMSDSSEVDGVLSDYFKRNVTLGRAAPDDFTIDQYHPDVEGADPGGN